MLRSFAAPQAGGGRAGVLGQLVARHPELLRPAPKKKPARGARILARSCAAHFIKAAGHTVYRLVTRDC